MVEMGVKMRRWGLNDCLVGIHRRWIRGIYHCILACLERDLGRR